MTQQYPGIFSPVRLTSTHPLPVVETALRSLFLPQYTHTASRAYRVSYLTL